MLNYILKSLIIILSLVFLLKIYLKIFKVYQLNGYQIIKTLNFMVMSKLNIFSLVMLVIFNLTYIIFYNNNLCLFILALLNIIISIVYIFKTEQNVNNKNNLVFTKRFSRFFILFLILNLSFLITFSFIIKTNSIYFLYVNFYLISILAFIISHFLILPLEILIKKFYILKAKNKIKKMKNLKVIGITGSFAKTSVKNYVYELLKTKYKVCKTQKSYNTEMGFTKVILNDLKDDDEILILEYGADHVHDIERLCKIVKPNYSIITGVTNQHLKTFKTLNNIILTKYELVKNTDKNGFVIFNGDNKISKDYYDKTNITKYLVGSSSEFDLFSKDVNIDYNGSTFKLSDNKNLEIEVQTKLLGRHNVINLMLALCMALKLGVDLNEIISKVKDIRPTEHRLNLLESAGKYILDDSFNANSIGVYYALEVLKTFKNNKIVITGGIVELGENQYEENYKLGKALKEFDVVVITNFINKKALLDGLGDYENKVFVVSNLNEAIKIIEPYFKIGDCVLFLNDLPDNYK